MAASPVIVGIGYLDRVGKDYLAKKLKDALGAEGIRTRITHFALELKLLAYQLFGDHGLALPEYYESVDPSAKDRPLPDLRGLTPRDIWISLGGAIKDIAPDYWVDVLMQPLDWYARTLPKEKRPQVIIIPDVRFPNEAEAIRSRGGFLVRLFSSPGQLELNHPLGTYPHWNATFLDDFKEGTPKALASLLRDYIKDTYPHVVS